MGEPEPDVWVPEALYRLLSMRRPAVQRLWIRVDGRRLPVADVIVDPSTGDLTLVAKDVV